MKNDTILKLIDMKTRQIEAISKAEDYFGAEITISIIRSEIGRLERDLE